MTTKERFEKVKAMVENQEIPHDCEVRFWINNCERQELLELGAEHGLLCQTRSDETIFLNIEKDNIEITLWE
jgi:hypothetical protein